MNATAFVLGVLLLVAVGLCAVRWEIDDAAREWYDNHGSGCGFIKPWYVRRYDGRNARRRR